MRVPFTPSMTPGENIKVTPGSTVSVARAPIIRSSRMMHGLLKESILIDWRKKPPFDMRLHADCAPQPAVKARAASATAMTVNLQFMLMLLQCVTYSCQCHVGNWHHNHWLMLAACFISLSWPLSFSNIHHLCCMDSAMKITVLMHRAIFFINFFFFFFFTA